jgi:regulator of nonsense transcripts 3
MSSKIQKTRKEKEKERDKERKLSQQEPNNERLKTVVRRLPPNLPEGIFWQSVQSWVTEDTAVWKTYYPGKVRKRYALSLLDKSINYHIMFSANKENIPSRAYIAFKTKEQLELFSREYDGHVFRDKTGAHTVLFWTDNC